MLVSHSLFSGTRCPPHSPVSVAGAIFLLGGVLQTVCKNRETMLAGRFFAGVGIGELVCDMTIVENWTNKS